jgi:hypothetical protein
MQGYRLGCFVRKEKFVEVQVKVVVLFWSLEKSSGSNGGCTWKTHANNQSM